MNILLAVTDRYMGCPDVCLEFNEIVEKSLSVVRGIAGLGGGWNLTSNR